MTAATHSISGTCAQYSAAQQTACEASAQHRSMVLAYPMHICNDCGMLQYFGYLLQPYVCAGNIQGVDAAEHD
jgi:hypothetical protein